MTSATAEGASGARVRILEGTSRAICKRGVRTSLEEIAAESGCARATIYRHFPGGREELLAALVRHEHARFFLRLGEAVRDATSIEEVVFRGLVVAHRALRELEVLQIVLREQPELLEPSLVRTGPSTLRLVADFLAPFLQAAAVEETSVADHADYLARMVLSLMSSPGRFDLDDPEATRDLVRCELLGAMGAPA